MKKMGVQALLCVLIFCFFTVTGNISVGSISGYSDAAIGYITKDYSIADIKDETVAAVSAAVEKPGEFYRAVTDSRTSQEFISPVDEISVSVFNEDEDSGDFRYMSDESIVVHSSGRGMVESVIEEESGTGYTVTVRHDDGIISKYIGCTRVYAEEKESVGQGQVIAEVNNEGIRTLVFEIWKNGVKENPGEYIK